MGDTMRRVLFAVAGALGLIALAYFLARPAKGPPPKPEQIPPPLPSAPAPNSAKPPKRKADDDAGDDGDVDEPEAKGEPAYMFAARKDLGTREKPGKVHERKIVDYFRDAGFPNIRNDETAWCAAFVGAHLERQGIPSSKSLAARSYERWGDPVKAPYPGCIVVMWRGDPNGWQGHVGFYVRHDDRYVYVLGGNQGDAVSIARFPRSRVVAYRAPPSLKSSRTIAANVVSTLAGVGAGALPLLTSLRADLQGLGEYSRSAMQAAIALSVIVSILTMAYRIQDHYGGRR